MWGAGLLRASVSLSARSGRGTRYPEPPPTLLGMETPRMLSTPTQHHLCTPPPQKSQTPRKHRPSSPNTASSSVKASPTASPPAGLGPACIRACVSVCVGTALPPSPIALACPCLGSTRGRGPACRHGRRRTHPAAALREGFFFNFIYIYIYIHTHRTLLI